MVDGAKLLIRSGADWRDKRSTSSFSHLSRVGSFEKSQVASAQCTATQLPCLPLQCRSDRWFQVFSNKNWPYSRFDLISCLHCIHRTLLLGYSIRKFLREMLTHRIPQESLFIAVGHEGRLHAVFGRWAYPPTIRVHFIPRSCLWVLCVVVLLRKDEDTLLQFAHKNDDVKESIFGPLRLRDDQFILQMVSNIV